MAAVIGTPNKKNSALKKKPPGKRLTPSPTSRQTTWSVTQSYASGRGADDSAKLNLYVLPRMGKTKACDVTKRDIIEIIDHIALEREALVQADRTKALLSSNLRLGTGQGRQNLAQHNPADRIRKRSTRKRRAQLFTHEELKALWEWCNRNGTPGRNFRAEEGDRARHSAGPAPQSNRSRSKK